MTEKTPEAERLLAANAIRSAGVEALIVAMIQQAMRDCHYERRSDPGVTQVQLDAAEWLLTTGAELACFLAIPPGLYRQAIERVVPLQLRFYVEKRNRNGEGVNVYEYGSGNAEI